MLAFKKGFVALALLLNICYNYAKYRRIKMGTLKTLTSTLIFGALTGYLLFTALLILGSDESRTGIEKDTSCIFAVLGAVVVGFFAHSIQCSISAKESVSLPTSLPGWLAFLAVGAIVIYKYSGGEDLGPAGDGFHRDFDHWWQAASLVFFCFFTGVGIRWANVGLRRLFFR
jgi:hypothetical protein